jgi:hypothetical protein
MDKNTILDILAAVAVGLMLCAGALHYFDVLIK